MAEYVDQQDQSHDISTSQYHSQSNAPMLRSQVHENLDESQEPPMEEEGLNVIHEGQEPSSRPKNEDEEPNEDAEEQQNEQESPQTQPVPQNEDKPELNPDQQQSDRSSKKRKKSLLMTNPQEQQFQDEQAEQQESSRSSKKQQVKRAKHAYPATFAHQRRGTGQPVDNEASNVLPPLDDNTPPEHDHEKLMLELNFEDEYKVRRVMSSTDSKNKISGCLFCFIGLIVLGFGIFLCERGANSQRDSQIMSYVENVFQWNTKHKPQFSELLIDIIVNNTNKIEMQLHKGEHEFQELPIHIALGRVTNDEVEEIKKVFLIENQS